MKTTLAPNPSFEQRYLDTAQAFDHVAPEYDGPLGNNRLVQQMREVLWREVERRVQPGAKLLDMGCGAGIDAAHFANKGYQVTAIDGSAGMVQQTQQRAKREGVTSRLNALQLGIQALHELRGRTFDMIYADLGALNCLASLDGVAGDCASLLSAGGYLVLSVIGRYCPWEFLYYVAHGDLRRASIRFARDQVPVGLQGHTVWTRYYTPGELYRNFKGQFRWDACRAIGLLVPPPYMVGLVERHADLFRLLARLDERVGTLPLINRAGDHFLLVMSRRD